MQSESWIVTMTCGRPSSPLSFEQLLGTKVSLATSIMLKFDVPVGGRTKESVNVSLF